MRILVDRVDRLDGKSSKNDSQQREYLLEKIAPTLDLLRAKRQAQKARLRLKFGA
jgi:hypothetical protein